MRPIALALCVVFAACHGAGPSGPTFYKDVEPLMQQSCQGCHVEGGIAPFALTTHAQVQAKLPDIVQAVEARLMPPWMPGDNGVPLKHKRALTDEQIALIRKWADSGAPAGSSSDHRVRVPQVPEVRADLTLQVPEPYTPKAGKTDDYRCFVIDPKIAQTMYATGIDIQPGVRSQLHHVIAFLALDQSDTLARLQATDDADPGPGYDCFGDPMIGASTPSAFPPLRVLGGWAPGQGATRLPQGTGIPIPPRSKIVLQMHYNTLNGRAPDQTSVAVELVQSGVKEGLLFPLVQQSFTIAAGAKDVVVEKSFPIPSFIGAFTIYGVSPHMHLFGTQISVSHTSAGVTKNLVDIPHWDFHWQGGYEMDQPVHVVTGDALKLRCVYDNSAEHQPWIDGAPMTPRTLKWGEKTTDEMCLAFLYVTQ